MRTVTARFSSGQTFVATESLWQYDYGFVLVLQGLELPTYYEVHFSHTFTQLADVNIGDANGVAIDDKFLRHDGYLFAWVYLHDEATDGYTKYQVKIPIAKRARPPEDPPTHEQQEALAQAITALNEQTGRAEDAANRAEQSKVSAKASEDAASLSEQNASGSAEAAASSERNAAQSELDAAANAAIAMDKASDATQAANAAIAAANTAEGAAGSVTEDARRAETAATHAEQYSNAAQIAKEGAVASEQAAQRHKNDAVDAKEAAQSAASTATQKAQAAEDYAGVANQKAEVATDKALEASLSATDASGSASNAATSETQAAASATAAGNAETEAKNARDLAQGYATAAQTAKGLAEAAQAAAETAQGKAEAAEESVEDMLEAFQSPTATAVTLEPGSDATASYNGETGVFTFGIPEGAPGTDGYSPSASVSQDDDVTTITITDEDGTTTADIDLSDYAKDDDLTELRYTKADIITDTVSGAIASFPDGADGMPVHKLVVNLSPKQDLHGQDAPYPAGGGKNLFNKDATFEDSGYYLNSSGAKTSSANWSIAYIPVTVGQAYSISGIVAGVTSAYFWWVDSNKDPVDEIGLHIKEGYQSITAPAGTAYIGLSFISNTENASYDGNTLQVEKGSPTSYAPYSNECPITGWTGCEVNVDGKNLLKLDESEMIASGWNRLFPFSIKAGTYTMSCQNKLFIGGVNKSTRIQLTGSTTTGIRGISQGYTFGGDNMSFSFSITEEEANIIEGILFEPVASGLTFQEINAMQNMIELGSTASAYEPYTGNSYSINWQTEAGTVYGGTVDLVSGVLIIDRAYKTFGELTGWQYRSDQFDVSIPEGKPQSEVDQPSAFITDTYETKTSGTSGLYPNDTCAWQGVTTNQVLLLRVRDHSFTTLAEFRTGTANVRICYELATPITIQLTPEQVTTLKGQNNIWANGDSVEVEYCADTKLYIDKKLAALVAALS